MVTIGKKVLGLVLLVCLAAAPLACVNVNPTDSQPKTEVIKVQTPPAQPKTEVNVNTPPTNRPKTEVNVNN